MQSHPARDAWIEIFDRFPKLVINAVASSTGCVDWNRKYQKHRSAECRSHPARDAWIEIACALSSAGSVTVASRTGCVDWNSLSMWRTYSTVCRIPHGMRGLKSNDCLVNGYIVMSHPARDAWIEINPCELLNNRIGVASRTGCVDWNIDHINLIMCFNDGDVIINFQDNMSILPVDQV